MIPKTPSFKLDGKRALIVGASSGIGFGCACAMAEAGAEVILAATRQAVIEEKAALLSAAGLSAKGHALDISDIPAMRDFIADQEPFDILLNSAGVARHGKALDTQEDDFDLVSELNFKGAYFLAQSVAKRLIAAKKPGSLITISSQMGLVGGIERAVYCGTKHAVEGFTKAMAIEFGPHNIRVNTISPTFIRTALTAPTFEQPDKVAWIEEKIKLDRIGEVEDIMGSAVFLASDASAMITGTTILVDGGWTAD